MRQKVSIQIANAVGLAMFIVVIVGAAGCGLGPTGPFRSGGLPSKEFLVGGGFQIDWVAPEDGTAYVVEETTTKILQTETLQKGGKFEFNMSAGPDEFEKALGIKMAEAAFNLYFVPTTETAQ